MNLEDRLDAARALLAAGREDEALSIFLRTLEAAPGHIGALLGVGACAHALGRRSAAMTAYEAALTAAPDSPVAHVNLGLIRLEDAEPEAAARHFEAALRAAPALAEAHQGLARALTEIGESARAAAHWRAGFAGRAVVSRPFRGTGAPIPLLLLVSARGGNLPTRTLIDEATYAVTAVYADFAEPGWAAPEHAIIFNAIADADACPEALEGARRIAARSAAPVINPPGAVARTGRLEVLARVGDLAGVRAPRARRLSRAELLSGAGLDHPLLVRAPGFNTGRHFVKVDRPTDMAAAIGPFPGDSLLAIEYLDLRGADGAFRKYRMMRIDGALHPAHLAISDCWKTHHFTAGMEDRPDRRAEEARFLEAPEAVLGARAMAALEDIGRTLGLDYQGVDFALGPGGEIVVFEANAGMVLNPPAPGAAWDYRRGPAARAIDAAKAMIRDRAARA